MFHNGSVFSTEGPPDCWILIKDGKVAARGYSAEQIKDLNLDNATKIDLQGKLLTPGIGDAHIHVGDVGWGREVLDLHSARSKDDFVNLTREYLASEKWLTINDTVNNFEALGWWDESDVPDLETLDSLVSDRPAIFHRRCLHVMALNSKAISALRLDSEEFVPPANIEIVRDENGKATGLLREGFNLVSEIRVESSTTLKRRIILGLETCVKAGLTQVHACEGKEPGLIEAWIELAKENKLKIRVFLSIFYDAFVDLKTRNILPKQGVTFGDRLTFDRVKLFADGALGANTAALSKHYKQAPHSGIALESIESMTFKLTEIMDQGYRAEIHVIGDRAVDNTLDGLVNSGYSIEQIRKFRHILNHSQIIRKDQHQRIIDLGCSCSIQPQFVTSDAPWVYESVPDELHDALYTWKTFLDLGIPVHGGSDSPVEEILPLEAIEAAIKRSDGNGGTFMPAECLTLREALSIFTHGVAQGVRLENKIGSLLPGQLADFNILNGSLDDTSVQNWKILESFVEGKLVFKA